MSPHDPAYADAPAPAAAPVPLPAKVDLGQLRRQAKELRRAVLDGAPAALTDVRAFHPRGEDAVTARDTFSLRDAQVTLARKHGHPGWNALVQAVGTERVEERGMHRWFGVEWNNEVWDLIDAGLSPDSPRDDREMALYGAYACARHWLEVGTVANRARGEHVISRAAAAIGELDVALRHARRCLELVEANPDAMADWDAPFAHEALARALAGTGDPAAGAEHRAEAIRLTAALADPEDRAILDGELARAPWFGLI